MSNSDAYQHATCEVLMGQRQEFIDEWCQPPARVDHRFHAILLSSLSAEEKLSKCASIMKQLRGELSTGKYKYFLTLTAPVGIDVNIWLDCVIRLLKRKIVKTFEIVAEHIGSKTNMHAHILMECNYQFQRDKKHLGTYIKKTGASLAAQNLQPVINDNGISYYCNCENPTFKDLSEFEKFVLDKYNESQSTSPSQSASKGTSSNQD